ncbi:MAG: Lumazine-binding protein [Moorea sp. SIO2B7]|nr:Lumazine-binding protein [Moorena sp. SIO2B7]
MFTGIIKEMGTIYQVNDLKYGCELVVDVSPSLYAEVGLKSNIALNGKALTVLDKVILDNKNFLKVNVYSSTKVKQYREGNKVNLERAIRLGEEIAVCVFSGVPSGICQLTSLKNYPEEIVHFQIKWDNFLFKYLDIKDVVYLDGVFLQIKNIKDDLLSFELYPETIKKTNLGDRKIGDILNIEIDPIIKKLAQILERKKLI